METDTFCVICLDPLDPCNQSDCGLFEKNCKCIYSVHQKCIQKWFREKKSCLMCRKSICFEDESDYGICMTILSFDELNIECPYIINKLFILTRDFVTSLLFYGYIIIITIVGSSACILCVCYEKIEYNIIAVMQYIDKSIWNVIP